MDYYHKQSEENTLRRAEAARNSSTDRLRCAARKEQLTLEVARLIREFFLQQNAFHDVDSYCAPGKSARILQSILYFEEKARAAIEAGVSARELIAAKSKNKIGDAKFYKDYEKILNEADAGMENEINEMVRKNAA